MDTITADQLKSILTGEPRMPVINVLDRDEYRREHIPGTLNIPLDSDDFVREVEGRVASKSDPVVVYCASSACNASEKAAGKLERAGFRRVHDFADGLEGWRRAGYALDRGDTHQP